jgi:hypothetical protein
VALQRLVPRGQRPAADYLDALKLMLGRLRAPATKGGRPMSIKRMCAGVAALASLFGAAACSSSDPGDASSPVSTTTSAPAHEPATRLLVRGTATLDGRPVESDFVGAVVLDDGLVTPCQTTLPPVTEGGYTASIYTAEASAGCGKPGSAIALWIFADDKILFSTNTLAWPDDASVVASFDPTYTRTQPNGATPEVAQFQGGVIASGRRIKSGTVEAYVGDTKCGVASVRDGRDFTGYVLSVVGPDSIDGCTTGAHIAFRVDGEPADPARPVTNTPPGEDETLDLRVA